MKRVARYTLNAVTVLSLLLCVATVGLWVRSYWREDLVFYTRYVSYPNYRDYIFASRRGGIMLGSHGLSTSWLFGERRSTWRHDARPFAKGDYRPFLGPHARLGFGYLKPSRDTWYIDVPHWFVVVMTSLLPAIRLAGLVVGRRPTSAGHCATCGYDLRASPDRCPECGTIVAKGKE